MAGWDCCKLVEIGCVENLKLYWNSFFSGRVLKIYSRHWMVEDHRLKWWLHLRLTLAQLCCTTYEWLNKLTMFSLRTLISWLSFLFVCSMMDENMRKFSFKSSNWLFCLASIALLNSSKFRWVSSTASKGLLTLPLAFDLGLTDDALLEEGTWVDDTNNAKSQCRISL